MTKVGRTMKKAAKTVAGAADEYVVKPVERVLGMKKGARTSAKGGAKTNSKSRPTKSNSRKTSSKTMKTSRGTSAKGRKQGASR